MTLGSIGAIRSPKLRTRDSIFPFYAGFSAEFVSDVLASFPSDSLVVDPWNGAGTTTTTAAMNGRAALGLDINPAMVIVARAKLSTLEDAERAIRWVSRLTKVAHRYVGSDMLQRWFSRQGAALVRGLSVRIWQRSRSIDEITCSQAILMVALFNVCRARTRHLRTSNPTWHRSLNGTRRIGLAEDDLLVDLKDEVQRLVSVFRLRNLRKHVPVDVSVADSRDLTPVRNDSAGLVITSPPYCTRIDYAQATAIELAASLVIDDSDFRILRTCSLGTTAVVAEVPSINECWGIECVNLLSKIKSHPSRASSTYYYKTHVQYFDGLYRSLAEISRVLAPNGFAIFVVQDSYYKELHNDLATILAEMAATHHLDLRDRRDITVPSIGAVNPGARSYRRGNGATESMLTFHSAKLSSTRH
jgi:DNA modification methylase